MLIRIEKVDTNSGWFVVLDAWRVKFRSFVEAEAFVIKLTERINAPHALPEYNEPFEELPS
jgi:hypothetical protein